MRIYWSAPRFPFNIRSGRDYGLSCFRRSPNRSSSACKDILALYCDKCFRLGHTGPHAATKEISMNRSLFLAAAILVAACAEPVSAPMTPSTTEVMLARQTAAKTFARYVALGTSNSMGVQSAGIFSAGQKAAWPAQLASRANAQFALPLIGSPGCPPPLLAPLATDLVLAGAFAAFGAGDDLVTSVMETCAPLVSGVTLPTNNVAISGAKARTALYSTLESEQAINAKRGELYSRVLPPGKTQVTAMLSENPTFVSVELAANEVLPASTGRLSAMTSYPDWERDYDQILDSVARTGARAVLVGLPDNAANFPSVRRAREFFNQWPYLLTLGISVSTSCYYSSNYIFIPGYILTLLSHTPTTATCADVPGEVDYIITASDMAAINDRMAQMNSHIQAKATQRGYAFFKLAALYDLPKGSLSMYNVLFSSNPFGSSFSLDGVHPSAQGQAILADAAVQAINSTYKLGIQ